MPGVLAMTAFEVGYPMTLLVLMEADNVPVHVPQVAANIRRLARRATVVLQPRAQRLDRTP
jgi:hypothetical protein